MSIGVFGFGLSMAMVSPAFSAAVVNCSGAAMVGGAQLVCSHVDPKSPAQLCTYSWALATTGNQTQVIEGTVLLVPGASNVTVFQGSGFSHAMSGPIVMCQGKRKPTAPRL